MQKRNLLCMCTRRLEKSSRLFYFRKGNFMASKRLKLSIEEQIEKKEESIKQLQN